MTPFSPSRASASDSNNAEPDNVRPETRVSLKAQDHFSGKIKQLKQHILQLKIRRDHAENRARYANERASAIDAELVSLRKVMINVQNRAKEDAIRHKKVLDEKEDVIAQLRQEIEHQIRSVAELTQNVISMNEQPDAVRRGHNHNVQSNSSVIDLGSSNERPTGRGNLEPPVSDWILGDPNQDTRERGITHDVSSQRLERARMLDAIMSPLEQDTQQEDTRRDVLEDLDFQEQPHKRRCVGSKSAAAFYLFPAGDHTGQDLEVPRATTHEKLGQNSEHVEQ
ncbi:hypothetical protein MMC25_003784 [Agyrium rufum]|nr:hypothetical protein [Agyrium rufum]